MISATLIIALVSILTIHAINEITTNTTTRQPQQASINASFSNGVTIYVVGPQTLIQELINANIPQSTIRLANVPNLSLISPGSVVVIDWNYLLNYFSSNASLIIDSLESLFRGEDLIVIAVSNPNESLAASSALAIAWARAYGSKFTMYPAIGGLYVAAFGDRHHLIFTAGYNTTAIPGIIKFYESIREAWAEALKSSKASFGIYNFQSSSGASSGDPCLAYETQYSSYGVTFDFQPNYGGQNLQAYSDGNGTFLYDTCVFIYKQPVTPAGGPPYYGISPAVWLAYYPTSTMINNHGSIQYFIGTIDHGSGWNDYKKGYDQYLRMPINSYTEFVSGASPQSTSNYQSSFSVTFSVGPDTYKYSESPALVQITQENTGEPQLVAFNNTWYFYFSGPQNANQEYQVAYTEQQAAWVLPQGLYEPQSATLYEEFGVKLLTARLVKFQFLFICYVEYEYKFVWTDFAWVLHYSPKSGISASGLIINQQSPYYVSGITTYSRQGYSLCW
jgi:hypothetical protein